MGDLNARGIDKVIRPIDWIPFRLFIGTSTIDSEVARLLKPFLGRRVYGFRNDLQFQIS